MTKGPPGVIDYLLMTPEQLWDHLTMKSGRGSGPGGQRRNKVHTAVRLELPALGAAGASSRYRSHEENRRSALRALRREIALLQREAPPPHALERVRPYLKDGLHISMQNPDLPLLYAVICGLFFQHQGDYRAVAAALSVSPGRLNRFLLEQKSLLNTVKKNPAYGEWFDKVH